MCHGFEKVFDTSFFLSPQSGQKMSLKKFLPEGPCFQNKKKTASRSAVFFRRRYFLLWGIAKNYIMYWGFLRLLLYVIFVQKCAQICIFFTSFFVYILQYVFSGFRTFIVKTVIFSTEFPPALTDVGVKK